MAQKTSLSAFGTPGPVHSFSPKAEAPVGGPHNPGHITSLKAYALPGRLQSFSPKTPEAIGGPHNPDHITALAVYAVPGGVHVFTAKTPEAVPIPTGPPEVGRQKLHGWNRRRLLQWGGRYKNAKPTPGRR